MFDLNNASKVLRRLEESIPEPAREVLLPAARRGVAALQKVQEGFFIRGADGRLALSRDRLSVAPEVAAAEYLGALRDATHGFSTNRGTVAQREKVARLLAIHDGHLHHDIGLLAWLYLLDLLSSPARLRNVLGSQRR